MTVSPYIPSLLSFNNIDTDIWSHLLGHVPDQGSFSEPGLQLNGWKQESQDGIPLEPRLSCGTHSTPGNSLVNDGSSPLSNNTVSISGFFDGLVSVNVDPNSAHYEEATLSNGVIPSPTPSIEASSDDHALHRMQHDESLESVQHEIDPIALGKQFVSVHSLCTTDLEDGFEHAFKSHSQGMMTLLADTTTHRLEEPNEGTFEIKLDEPSTGEEEVILPRNEHTSQLFTTGSHDSSVEINEPWRGIPLSSVRDLEQKLRVEGKYEHLPQEFLTKFIGRVDVNGHEQGAWRCYISGCQKECIRRDHAVDHIRMHLDDRSWPCNLCTKSFLRSHDLKRHRETHDSTKLWQCVDECGRAFNRKDLLYRHMENSCHVLKCGEKSRGQGGMCHKGPRSLPPQLLPQETLVSHEKLNFRNNLARPEPPNETLPIWIASFQHALAVLHSRDEGNLKIKPGRKRSVA